MKSTNLCTAFFFCFLTLISVVQAENELFPFVLSFDAPTNLTNLADRLDAPAGQHGFVRAENGHFRTNKGRIQFWGSNTCFSANFLDHAAADRMADRMARFGINCVRLHHMDMADIWGGYGAKTLMTLEPGAMDKLDYYVAALKKRGIYVNLNLHVSRSLDERDGFPKREGRTGADKGIDNYYRPFIDANKKYAKDLLEHVNPYTGNAYKDEPAVAMVEINNENSIVCTWAAWGGLHQIQDPFLAELRVQWNDWLRNKYGSDAELKKSWNCRSVPLGAEMLKNGDFPNGYVAKGDGWVWETNAQTSAEVSNVDGILRIDLKKKSDVVWLPQLVGSGFNVKKDQLYTIVVKARANRNASVNIGLGMNHDPWQSLGFSNELPLTTDWHTFRFTVIPTADDDNARVAFGTFQDGAVVEIESVSLKTGGDVTLPATDGEPEKEASLETKTIPVIWKKDASRYAKEAVDDFCIFLFDVEAKYWDEMYRYLKEDIKVRQPVSGTQLEYGGIHPQAKMDYCDIHAYWNHPVFPRRDWDMNDWYLHNRALVNHLDRQILPSLATKRVYGKPFTLSEYNHPFPNQYAAEGFPIIAAFGAFQNWDGIFPFAYAHSKDVEPKKAGSFFDTVGNTVQMAHMFACHTLFCDNYNEQSDEKTLVAPLTWEKERAIFVRDRSQYGIGFSGLDLDMRNALLQPTSVDVAGKIKEMPKPDLIPENQKAFRSKGAGPVHLYYNLEQEGKGYTLIKSPTVGVFTGFIEEGKRYPLADGRISFGKTNLGWATVSLTRLASTEKENRWLLVATGATANTDMKLESLGGDRITVGPRWGSAPIQCEGIPAELEFKQINGTVSCWVLDESGNRTEEIEATQRGESSLLILKPSHKTIWYEISDRKP